MAINLSCRLFSEISGNQITPSDHDAQTQDIRTLQSALANEILLARQNEQAILTDYIGMFTISTLPDAIKNAGKRVLVSDLGGGPGYLRATSGYWRRLSTTTAAIQSVPVSTMVSIDGLLSSPIINLTGSSFSGKATITVTNAPSMPQITVVAGSSVFSATGSMGISLNGASPISVAGIGVSGTWSDFAISTDGTTLTKIRGGSL